uniref:Uncharacterized protein n=1 Tax=Rhizophora mucronata TaxID=61149 RepID=A0A2P2NAE6_RHIMU
MLYNLCSGISFLICGVLC